MPELSHWWPWLSLAALGAFHGLNPAMGWLFAVALGLQERRLRAVLIALGPIALGHIAFPVDFVLTEVGKGHPKTAAHCRAVESRHHLAPDEWPRKPAWNC